MVRVPYRLLRLGRRPERGFTLVELMVVVIIVGVLAVVAIPTISGQMRSRRAQWVAKEVANLYRNGRLRAMGRGSAVLIRYDRTVDTNEGRLEVREAIRSDCMAMPVSSCAVTDWAPAAAPVQSQVVGQLTIKGRSELDGIWTRAKDPGGADKDFMDVCYTPMGRAFVRYSAGGQFAPLADVPRVRVSRVDSGGTPYGPERNVLVFPNGSARLGAAEATGAL